jgi:hypothetical protein
VTATTAFASLTSGGMCRTAVLDEPNRDGRTLVWTYNDSNNVTGKLTIKVRCFMP